MDKIYKKIWLMGIILAGILSAGSFNEFYYELYYKNDVEGMKQFVQKLEDPDAMKDTIGSTILMYVCRKPGLEEIFDLLIQKGADVNAKNAYWQTPIYFATENSVYYTKKLLEKGAKLDIIDYSGLSPLFYTIMGQLMAGKLNFEIIDLLLEYGADINTQITPPESWKRPEGSSMTMHFDEETQGATPLIFAVAAKNKEMVEYLLKQGADPNIKTKKGETALSIAEKQGLDEIAEVIKKYIK